MQSGELPKKPMKTNALKDHSRQEKRSIRFIVNPFSGRKTNQNISEIIHSAINSEIYNYEICLTKSEGHAKQLSREAIEAGIHIVVAVGGDGTINEVASQIINSETIFGIIPVGSGNGLARHMGIPLSVPKAIQLINESNITSIDTATINEKPFVSIAGIGFDALVAEKFSESNKRGFFSYLRIVIQEYFNYKPRKYVIQFNDGKRLEVRAFFISFANSSQFGYNTSIAPHAKLDDGKLDVCIVQKPRIFDMPTVANLLLLKRIHKSSLVKIIPSSGLQVIRSERAINLDGEAVKLKKKLEIKVKPLSLKIIIPKNDSKK